MRFFLIISFLSVFLFACKDELEKQVVQNYPNGKPMKVEHVNYQGNRRIVVKETRYFPNGNIEEEGAVSNGKKEGLWSFYGKDGFMKMEENYQNDILHGEFIVWYRSGDVNYQGEYFQGKPHGEWLFFKADGSESKRVVYDKGKKLSSESM